MAGNSMARNANNKSCLDLAVTSINLMPYIKVMLIDRDRNFTPKIIVSMGRNKGVKAVYTDHYAFIVELSGLPARKDNVGTAVKWNLAKPNGWEKYKKVSGDVADQMVDIIENRDLPIEKVIKKIDNLQDKFKFTAFGKTRIKGNKTVGKEGTITSLTDI